MRSNTFFALVCGLFISLSTQAQRFERCALPDSIDAHGQALCMLVISHYNAAGDTLTGHLIVNERIAEPTLNVFRELYDLRYPIECMTPSQGYADDEHSMRANNSSAYLYRTIAGTQRLSKHARGTAIDINPLYNPCFRVVGGRAVDIQPSTAAPYTDRTMVTPYTVTAQVVDIFRRHGFAWGGNWRTKKDYQHFEYRD